MKKGYISESIGANRIVSHGEITYDEDVFRLNGGEKQFSIFLTKKDGSGSGIKFIQAKCWQDENFVKTPLKYGEWSEMLFSEVDIRNSGIGDDVLMLWGCGDYVEKEERENPDHSGCLKFTAGSDNSSVGYAIVGGVSPNLYYKSREADSWSVWDGSSISLGSGESLYLRGDNPDGFSNSGTDYVKFVMSGSISANGSVMSLIDNGEGTTTTIPNDKCFNQLFSGCSALTKAPELGATSLTGDCYNSMFKGCTSLVTVPALPATTLSQGCYTSMFEGCTSLTGAPTLPATTLGSDCYSYMFSGCTSLVNALALPAMELKFWCYERMFSGCTSLVIAPLLPATSFSQVEGCYNQMFYGCSSLKYIECLATTSSDYNTESWVSGVSATGIFVKPLSMSRWGVGEDGIPSGWDVPSSDAVCFVAGASGSTIGYRKLDEELRSCSNFIYRFC